MSENYKQIGRQKHKVYGSVDTFMKVPEGTIHYMMPKCPGCGCNNVLSSSVVKSLCVDCGSLRNRFYTYMSQIKKYNNTHLHLAPDNKYRQLEEIVEEYKKRREAGLKVPDKLEQAEYMVKFWKGEVTSIGL